MNACREAGCAEVGHAPVSQVNDRAPAEPQQRARRDVLADACAARTALVGRRRGERRNLHEVEVVEQADPLMPASTCSQMMKLGTLNAMVPSRGSDDERDHDREHDSGNDGAFDGG